MADQEEVNGLRVFKVKLPMRIKTSSKKRQALNLNVYRNLHFRSLSAQKNKFYEVAKKLLRGIPPLGVITLHYEVCVESKRRLDIMNVGAIVDKYFSDTLTEVGIIEDDDYHNIPRVSFAFGGIVDKEHVLVTITEIEKRKESKPMRVLLDQPDIQRALTAYVDTLNIPNASGVKLEADSHGVITAEVIFLVDSGNLPPSNVPQGDMSEEAPKKRGRGGRPKGSKNLPKTEPKEDDDVGTPVQAGAADSSAGDPQPSEIETTSADSEEVAGPSPTGGTKKGNLFGDEESQSSETDTSEEPPLVVAPKPSVKGQKGSIFDA